MTPFYLPAASHQAHVEDRIFLTLLVMTGVVLALLVVLLVGFAVRYRAGSPARRGALPAWVQHEFEVGWTSATLITFLFLFWWTASSELHLLTPPQAPFEIHVVAKQWMWKVEQPGGAREINTLHAPMGVPVRLVMTSQDVIHSFGLPAFRVKQDVLPGRYTEITFVATRPGAYQLFCDQYCGLDHAHMLGEVVIASPADYERWAAGQPAHDTLEQAGEKVFVASGCGGCHGEGAAVHAPPLDGLYGSTVPLAGGRFAVADEAYIRDCILNPRGNVPAGYAPIMPSFEGVLGEEQLVPLIAYVKSLKASSS